MARAYKGTGGLVKIGTILRMKGGADFGRGGRRFSHALVPISRHLVSITARPPWALRRNNSEIRLRSFCVVGSEMMGSDGL
jgi:hypothetical protein